MTAAWDEETKRRKDAELETSKGEQQRIELAADLVTNQQAQVQLRIELEEAQKQKETRDAELAALTGELNAAKERIEREIQQRQELAE
jgi:hypothetical protein